VARGELPVIFLILLSRVLLGSVAKMFQGSAAANPYLT